MKYPDGTTVRNGDLIWWNGGVCTGYVQRVVESAEHYKQFGLDDPCIILSPDHPFDSEEKMGIAYPQSSLADDGIGLIQCDDLVRLREAETLAKTTVEMAYDRYAASLAVQAEGIWNWVFTFKKHGDVVQIVNLPTGSA